MYTTSIQRLTYIRDSKSKCGSLNTGDISQINPSRLFIEVTKCSTSLMQRSVGSWVICNEASVRKPAECIGKLSLYFSTFPLFQAVASKKADKWKSQYSLV